MYMHMYAITTSIIKIDNNNYCCWLYAATWPTIMQLSTLAATALVLGFITRLMLINFYFFYVFIHKFLFYFFIVIIVSVVVVVVLNKIIN